MNAALDAFRKWAKDKTLPQVLKLSHGDTFMAGWEEGEAERKRLRKQNHDAAARRDREDAHLKSDRDRLRCLMREASDMHNRHQPEGRADLDISGYGQAAAAVLIDENKRLRAALAELVALKTLRDTEGKTAAYEQRQPLAWQAAREALGGSE